MPDTATPPAEAARARKLSATELVLMVAALGAINGMSVDMMLPALPQISDSLNVANANDRQSVIVLFAMSAGVGTLIYGPLADAFGRRRVLLASLAVYALGGLICVAAQSLSLFLFARIVQGFSVAATRVVSVALVRDMFSGPRMAQIMSTVMMISLLGPISAPALGQAVLAFGPWRWIFVILLTIGVGLFAWCYFRMPETLTRDRRVPLSIPSLIETYSEVLRNRTTMGYTLANTLVMASFFAFLASSQQILADTFEIGVWLPLPFALIAGIVSVAQLINARVVMRNGMRPLAHGAAIAYAGLAGVHLIIAWFVPEDIWLFMGLMMATMFAFGFIGANSGAIAMEPMGRIAGSAASFTGFFAAVIGAGLGGFVAHQYDGTVIPFLAGQVILGTLAVLVVYVTERGKLFTTPAPDAAPQKADA